MLKYYGAAFIWGKLDNHLVDVFLLTRPRYMGVSIGAAVHAQRAEGHPQLEYVNLESRISRKSYRIRSRAGHHYHYSLIVTMVIPFVEPAGTGPC